MFIPRLEDIICSTKRKISRTESYSTLWSKEGKGWTFLTFIEAQDRHDCNVNVQYWTDQTHTARKGEVGSYDKAVGQEIFSISSKINVLLSNFSIMVQLSVVLLA